MGRKVAAKKTAAKRKLPYNVMIYDAVACLGEKNGSTPQAIGKYIARNFRVTSAGLGLELKKAVRAGKVVVRNGRFLLPVVRPRKQRSTSKRRSAKRRRRPAKKTRRSAKRTARRSVKRRSAKRSVKRRSAKRPAKRSAKRSAKRRTRRPPKSARRSPKRMVVKKVALRRSKRKAAILARQKMKKCY